MKFDSIIFDIDGTLWDSRKVVAEAWNNAIESAGITGIHLTKEILTGLFGKPMDEIAAALFPNHSEKERAELSERCYSYENELLETKPGAVYPGVKETMELLAEKMPLFIVSNCQSGYIEVCMKGCGIEALIRDHLCYGDTKLPKSGTLKQLIQKNRLKAPVYVGDTQGDADACADAGIPMIYASYGFGQVTEMLASITRFSELPELLQRFC